MEHKISVVVPVYNVEKYLDRCVESILVQTFQDFELILVDDGSPDNCPQMCDNWAERDSRIRVIHKENGGLPDARNYGINAACGEYITFVDSDDWVEKEFLETLYQGMIQNNADVVQCNYQQVYGEKKIERCFAPRELDEEAIQDHLIVGMANDKLEIMSNTRWNKLYRAELVKKAINLCDVAISMGEDYLMNFAVFGYCKKIVILDTPPLYNYFFNEMSISSIYHPKNKYSKKAFYQNLKRIAQEHGCYAGNEDDLRNRRYAHYIYECALSDWSRADRQKEIREIVQMLDRKSWRSSIKMCKAPAEQICLLMTYLGLTDLMLRLVDFMKRKHS